MTPQSIDDLPTPALILDRAVLSRNLKRMSERLRAAGVMLRPHLKTAKSVQVGRMAVEGHDGRITVSTLAEAAAVAAASGIEGPTIIAIGEVVRLRASLHWLDNTGKWPDAD